MMIKRVMTVIAATGMCASAFALSLADARAQIGDAIADPGAMQSIVSQLSAADQVSFLADVNEAISKMPGSVEEQTAKFLDANTAAMKGAAKGNVAAMLAETFATVPPEALTVINEEFAANLFNRAADPAVTYTDADFTKIAQAMMTKVQERNAATDDAGVRDTFAILMLVRASNGTPADLADTLVAGLPDENTREMAANEWIPPALGRDQPKSYEPMLGAADAGEAPNYEMVLRLNSAQVNVAMMLDIATSEGVLDGGFLDSINGYTRYSYTNADDGGTDSGMDRIPFFNNIQEAARHVGEEWGTKGARNVPGTGAAVVGPDGADVVMTGGQTIPSGSKNAGTEPITVIDPNGNTVVVPGRTNPDDPNTGGDIPDGSKVAPGTNPTIHVPQGTQLAPGGTPTTPGGRRVGPGGRQIPISTEPGPYEGQS